MAFDFGSPLLSFLLLAPKYKAGLLSAQPLKQGVSVIHNKLEGG